jgi:hypothetical protein
LANLRGILLECSLQIKLSNKEGCQIQRYSPAMGVKVAPDVLNHGLLAIWEKVMECNNKLLSLCSNKRVFNAADQGGVCCNFLGKIGQDVIGRVRGSHLELLG